MFIVVFNKQTNDFYFKKEKIELNWILNCVCADGRLIWNNKHFDLESSQWEGQRSEGKLGFGSFLFEKNQKSGEN